MKKVLAIALSLALALSLAACGGSPSSSTPSASTDNGGTSAGSANQATGKVYFLNFKPEIASAYDQIAKDYEAETGVPVKVVTAAAGEYETTLKSEIAKSDAPTIFQINGPVGYQNWKNYCADLKDTALYSHLTDKTMAVTEGDGVYGIPYAVEGYGIIYNNAIMEKYFAMDGAKATSMDEINNFAKLKEVADDMQAKAADLGIEGVFASTALDSSSVWRFHTHLANVPVYYEMVERSSDNPILTTTAAKEIAFQYGAQYKNLFDLYTTDSCTPKTMLSAKDMDSAMAEFALGKVAMVQNGNWAWGQIGGVDGNTVAAEDVKFLPLYTGMDGEESQGLCVGTENFLSINAKASAEDQKASADFLDWLFSSETGKSYVTKSADEGGLGFIAPFDTFSDDEKPADPLSTEVMNWMAKDGVTSVPWVFSGFPSEEFKNQFGDALLQYCNGAMDWDTVQQTVVDAWASEAALAGR